MAIVDTMMAERIDVPRWFGQNVASGKAKFVSWCGFKGISD